MTTNRKGIWIPTGDDPPDMVSAFWTMVDSGGVPRAEGYDPDNFWAPLPDFLYAPQGHVHVEARGWHQAGTLGVKGARGIEKPIGAVLRGSKFDSWAHNWVGSSPVTGPTAWAGLDWGTNSLTAIDVEVEIEVPVLITVSNATTSYKWDFQLSVWSGGQSGWSMLHDEVVSFEYLARAGTMHRFLCRARTTWENVDNVRQVLFGGFTTRLVQAPGPYAIRFGESDHFFIRRLI